MSIKTFILGVPFLFLFTACANNEETKEAEAAPVEQQTEMEMVVADSLPKYSAEMVSNKKDFICGMPVSAGIADTAHYKGKVYGFCAKECKDEFLLSPESHIAKK